MNTKIHECKHYFILNGVKVHWNFKLLPKGFETITVFGHIFTNQNKKDLKAFLGTFWGRVIVNHSRIHKMQAESFKLKYFTFCLIYIYWWIKGLIKYKFNNFEAYYKIPFEREAYHYEKDFYYDKVTWKEFKW